MVHGCESASWDKPSYILRTLHVKHFRWGPAPCSGDSNLCPRSAISNIELSTSVVYAQALSGATGTGHGSSSKGWKIVAFCQEFPR
jgi:hypothetical protein